RYQLPASASSRELAGEPYTGNLYVRFDEEGGVTPTFTLPPLRLNS
ncbi:MAG: hypothetical protein K940chlam7_02057, partial [Chlamydiae bacterium]|nr:hypothetical protein [Chlamydiota bacterium]